jgi:hypothetical protein
MNFTVNHPNRLCSGMFLPGPGWAPYRAAARPLPHKRELVPEECEEDGSCVKGFLVGIGLEGAAALGIYGIWQLCHLVR